MAAGANDSHERRMERERYAADDVFGITRGVPKNYVAREHVDDELVTDLDRGRHVVVYGSSKQGKTCLRKRCIPESESIVVQCSNDWDVADVHAAMLKRAGYEVTLSEKRTVSGSRKITARFSASIPGLGGEVGAGRDASNARERTTRELELDPADVNDVIRALEGIDFDRYVVLEDFHYLPQETQADFAVALKAFHEASPYTFVIVGVWLEENRLIVHNGDLTGRVIAVDADEWTDDQLREVIERGADLLNVRFDPAFVDALLEHAFDSVAVVQEACREACRRAGVDATQPTTTTVGAEENALEIVDAVVGHQRARYESFLMHFAEGFGETRFELHRWLLYPILTADTEALESGLPYPWIRSEIEGDHPEGEAINPGNLTQALHSVGSLQSSIGVKPFVLDYDRTAKRLAVVDRGFLIWRATQDRGELLELAGLKGYLAG